MSVELILLFAVGAVGVAGVLYLMLDDFWFRHCTRAWSDETLRRLLEDRKESGQ